MYQSEINIKHSNRSHLYWGIDKSTGDIVGIDDVHSRGLNCNCKCAACEGDFIARKGKKNKHHFAHQSNYECVYANEIALYLFVKKLLEFFQQIALPKIPVNIGVRTELAKESWTATVGKVYYDCKKEQYPPLLIAMLDNQPTRIILAFGNYYSPDDYRTLKAESKEKNWECLTIPLPQITGNNSINPELVRHSVVESSQEKNWIHSALAERWRKRLNDAAIIPEQPFPHSSGIVYTCPIHRQERDGKFYARPEDCDGCPYNLSLYPSVKCLAPNGIRSLKDFKTPVEERMANIAMLQKENDERHIFIAQEQARREKLICTNQLNTYSTNRPPIPQSTKPAVSYEEKILVGKLDVAKRMERPSNEPVYDQFNIRWLKCTCCGAIRPSDKMSSYGGRNSANMGICSECARK